MGNTGDMRVYVPFFVQREEVCRDVQRGRCAGVCSFRCVAGGGMWRCVTWAMCGCVHFGVQLEEVCGDG